MKIGMAHGPGKRGAGISLVKHLLCWTVVCLGLGSVCGFGQKRTVAITVDDLPYASGGIDPAEAGKEARAVNRRLLAAFHAHRVPVTGFVIQTRVESLGAAGPEILSQWIGAGLDLGNHTYSHPDTNQLTVAQIEDEIARGEAAIGPLMRDAGKRLAFFRFPMNHAGDTAAKHDAIAAYLAGRGYQVATCTIDNSDYIFNRAYVQILARHDGASARRLRAEYLAYTDTEVEYYAGLNRQVFGYEPPQVMLLHANRLNADTIEAVLRIFSRKGYEFVPLAAAQADPAYRTPDTYVSKSGAMWGYRWARERNVKVDGRLEADPPKWITEYGQSQGAK